jgi:hypothetical protein
MSKVTFVPVGSQTTRRVLMARLAVTGAAAGMFGLGLASRPARAAPAKLPPGEIGYQPTPKGNARCDLCVNWQAPNACKLVSGAISPNGWCGLFVRKT